MPVPPEVTITSASRCVGDAADERGDLGRLVLEDAVAGDHVAGRVDELARGSWPEVSVVLGARVRHGDDEDADLVGRVLLVVGDSHLLAM